MRFAHDKSLFEALLKLQASLCFPLERTLYGGPRWDDTIRVLDFGCGNAAYLLTLREVAPDKRYLGYEIDPDYACFANAAAGRVADIVTPQTLSSLTPNSIDVIVVRFVLLHMEEIQEFFDFLSTFGRIGRTTVIVMDADDRGFRASSKTPLLQGILDKVQSSPAMQRTLRGVIEERLGRAGLRSAEDRLITMNWRSCPQVERFSEYVRLYAQAQLGAPLPERLLEEIEADARGEQAFQLSYFAARFEPTG